MSVLSRRSLLGAGGHAAGVDDALATDDTSCTCIAHGGGVDSGDGIARAEMVGVRDAFHGSAGEGSAYQVCSTLRD